MADAAVSILVSDLLWKLASPATKKFRLLRGLEDDVSALRVTLEQIQAVLQDAEEKQRKQKAVEIWLKSIRSASLEMEDVLDEVSTEAMLSRLHVQRGIMYRVRAVFSFNYNRIMIRNRITLKVGNIRKKLDAIAANKSNFDVSQLAMDPQVGGDQSERKRRETSSIVHFSKMYGRDAEMELITHKICNKDMARLYADDVRVYAIWGMGGVGKTTLAQLVYNHEKVRTHFDLKSWVYVSSEFEIDKLTRGITESIIGRRCKLWQLERMQAALQNKLRGKRFLIVLDDVWNDNRTKWDEVSKPLSCGAEGSIVMVTTRSQNIGTMMAKIPDFVHKVGCLSNEDSWSVFNMLAFGVERKAEDIRELEPIGMEIVEKCKGLPLAVKALGSLMGSKCSAPEWQRVNDSHIWELQENEVSILPALEISYNNLQPPHMKRCFAYCCMFPKGYEMAEDLLTELWIANGFIPSRGGADLDVIVEEIFNCLVSRSFFQDMQDESSNVKDRKWKPLHQKIFRMHDLMHDLARYVMRHDCSVIEPGKISVTPDQVLHLSSSCPDILTSEQDSEKLRLLRSMHIFAHEYKGNIIQISEYKCLRVLHLMGFGGSTLPESIGELKHLRYINLSGSNLNVLPKSIIYLQNLQSLILQSCMELRKLPDGIRYMRNLECLDIKNCSKLDSMPVGMKELTRLRSLSTFIVGHEKKTAKIGELGDLDLLGNELELYVLSNVQGLEEARKANLKCKRNLVSLVLDWRNDEGWNVGGAAEVLEGLEPNSSLTELKISYYQGINISPGWMANLKDLVRIEFFSCHCECILSLGKLPNLRYIFMSYMYFLERFHDNDNTPTAEDTVFPCLQELSISYCQRLHSLPSNFRNLKELYLSHCEELHSLPDGLQQLKHLTISGCGNLAPRCEKEIGEDWYKLSHVPNILLC